MITEKEFEQIKVVCEIACLHPSSFDEHAKVVSVKDILTYIETLVDHPKVSSTLYRTPDNAVAPFGGKDGFGNQLYAGQQASGVCPK